MGSLSSMEDSIKYMRKNKGAYEMLTIVMEQLYQNRSFLDTVFALMKYIIWVNDIVNLDKVKYMRDQLELMKRNHDYKNSI